MAEPAQNLLYLLPEQQRGYGHIPDIPRKQAWLTRQERDRLTQSFADIGASRLANVLRRAEAGDVADWYDLCQYFLLDPDMGGFYATRIDRVAQAPMVIKPNEYGDPRLAELAADFVSEQMGRIKNWETAKRLLLHAIAPGYSACEYDLCYDKPNIAAGKTATTYIRSLEWVHGNRFRYDEQWNLRLYDRGSYRHHSDGSQYGVMLKPNKWVVHKYAPVPSYPGSWGLMRACIFQLVFLRWNEKWWLGYTERNGGPTVFASVPANTPKNVRDSILSDLASLTSERFGVFELPSTLTIDSTAAAARSHEAYVDYAKAHRDSIAQLWLGASDIASPGEHGSQSAVGARGAMTTDPRMVTDAGLFAQTMHEGPFTDLLYYNAHKFGVPFDEIPVPKAVLKTADDQLKDDPTGRAQEQQQAQPGGGRVPEVGRPDQTSPAPGSAPQQGGQPPQDNLVLEIMKAFAASAITRGAAGVMLKRHGFSDGDILCMLEMPDPKAVALPSAGHSKTTTRATSTRSRSLTATALRRASAASGSSSSKPKSQQLKL